MTTLEIIDSDPVTSIFQPQFAFSLSCQIWSPTEAGFWEDIIYLTILHILHSYTYYGWNQDLYL